MFSTETPLDKAILQAPKMMVFPRELLDVVTCINKADPFIKASSSPEEYENWKAFTEDVKDLALKTGTNIDWDMYEVNLDELPLIIERERTEYKASLGNKGAPKHADTKILAYGLPNDRKLTVILSYTAIHSAIGFPFHRMKCIMKLDGKRISQAELSKLCT